MVEQGADMIGFLLGFLVCWVHAGAGDPRRLGCANVRKRIRAPRGVSIPISGAAAWGACSTTASPSTVERPSALAMKAITTPGHEGSIRFHVALGWDVQEVDDYAGLGRRRNRIQQANLV